MSTLKTLALGVLSAAWLVQPGVVAAQCVTKPATIATALNGKDAYALVKAEATKWKADSVLIRMMNTMEGALDTEGRATQWTSQFFSAAAKQIYIVSLTSSEMSCSSVDSVGGGPPVQVNNDTIFDTQRLLSIAQEAGGSKLDASTVKVMAELSQGADGARWAFSYAAASGQPMFDVRIDAKNGKPLK